MSEPPRYRWQAAQTLKQVERAAAERELADAQRALADARTDAAEAQRALAEHVAAVPRPAVQGEGATVRALELQRTADFALRHAETARALQAAAARAQERVAALHEALRACQAALGDARAGEQLIDRDRERLARDQQRRAERDAQLEVEDSRGNRGGRGAT